MDTSKLKKFASFARTSLIEQVGARLKTALADQSLARREKPAAVAELERRLKELGKERVIEMVAYTWFNRFCALRFMDVNRYTTIGTVSPAEGFTQPEILTEAKQGVIDEELKVDRAKIIGLLDGTRPSQDAQGEVYQQLLIAVCNSYHKLMPFMFEKIADYTELLIPEDLLSDSSVLAHIRSAITQEDTSDSSNPKSKIENPKSLDVEVIGWLYQFYIAEKKDDVFAELKKGKKITPENIPAATQLFTPHWIVRYLVENSLGRLWMLNHPDSKLVERMDYFIKSEEPETDFLKICSPEEIKVCDPACGSGHMLTYAFDLLYAIYEEQGYQATEIPRLILKHNLYGVEIDQRAGALAAFALVMKARQKDRRFFSRKPLDEDSTTPIENPKSQIQNPNVCVLETISIDPEDLSAYMDKVGRDLFTGGLQGVVNQWKEANNFGSLIRPLVTDVSDVLELLRERQMGQDLFLAEVHQKVLKALLQADYLSPKYHVVVANPPYMGKKNQNAELKKFLKSKFDNYKADTFSAFIVRCFEMCVEHGQLGFMSPFVWMFISSYGELRKHILQNKTITSLIQLEYSGFEGATVPICTFTFQNNLNTNFESAFIRLSSFRGADNQSPKTLEAIRDTNCDWFYRVNQSAFDEIPGSPIAYWVSPNVRQVFKKGKPLHEVMDIAVGLFTCDNERFLRRWHEVSIGNTRCFDTENNGIWFPYNKGGSFRKWYGNNEWLVNFACNGQEIRDYRVSVGQSYSLPGEKHYLKSGITWTATSSSYFGVRHSDSGFIFDVKGSSGFPSDAHHDYVLSFLCSNLVKYLLDCLNPTIETQTGDIGTLPVLVEGTERSVVDALSDSAENAVRITRQDWDAFEVSWDFTSHPLIGISDKQPTLRTAYDDLTSTWNERVRQTRGIEESNNQTFAVEYGIEGELNTDVPMDAITLTCNPSYRYGADKSESELEALLLVDTMREFISYAVGCMLGRYSLDKPGLILANQGDSLREYFRLTILDFGLEGEYEDSRLEECKAACTFCPDEDNVIPILDGDWFSDDITEQFKKFLRVTFGDENYEENLKFLEDALYPDNLTSKKRKTIRDYFLKDFYNHHIKLYKKRPIYWLFSSPKGTFNALIYMHRYRPDTVGTVLHYLRDFRDKLTHHAEHQQLRADSASASKSEKTQAIKDVAAIKKQLKELEDYEKTLFEVAARKIDIDLDDGVKHNYQLFGSVLRKIPGLDAKED